MVKSTTTATRAVDIDTLLQRAEGDWRDVMQVAAELESWSNDDIFNMLIDWPVAEERLVDLAVAARGGAMTRTQQVRYKSLLVQVEQARPTLAHLWKWIET